MVELIAVIFFYLGLVFFMLSAERPDSNAKSRISEGKLFKYLQHHQ